MPDTAPKAVACGPGPWLLLVLAAMAIAGAWFYTHQNVGHAVGGAISLPKVFWLFYALSAWFLVPIFLWRDRRLAPVLRGIFAWHLGWWWARAIAELVLMYGFHAWKPPYGIAHDVVAIALLVGLVAYHRQALAAAAPLLDRAALGFIGLLVVNLGCEIAFAYLFNLAVNGQTATLWFADDSARFAFINAFTTLADIVAYAGLALLVWAYYRPVESPSARPKAVA